MRRGQVLLAEVHLHRWHTVADVARQLCGHRWALRLQEAPAFFGSISADSSRQMDPVHMRQKADAVRCHGCDVGPNGRHAASCAGEEDIVARLQHYGLEKIAGPVTVFAIIYQEPRLHLQ